MGIDFNKFSGNFFKLEQDKRTIVKLSGWKETMSSFGSDTPKPGIAFDVVEENGVPVEKEWTVTSIQLIQKLRPFIEKAENEGKGWISVAVIKIGDKKDTKYAVEGLGSGGSAAPTSMESSQDATIAMLQNMVHAGALTKDGFDTALNSMREGK